ncbi:MAG: HD domain-containing protein [Proteobacteria bacterium]|nr:HD domain-containing protein [Pseudomonadota bacterium]
MDADHALVTMYHQLVELLEALNGVPQNAIYHPEGDALFHSLQVYAHAAAEDAEPELLAAALFHDVGKASAGPGHDIVGAELTEGLSARTRWCIAHHLDLLRHPGPTRALLHGTQRLSDLEYLRRWDLAGRDPLARVCSTEQAVSHVLEALDGAVSHGASH